MSGQNKLIPTNCICGEVIACVAQCGFWIPDTYEGDFIDEFEITPGTLDVTASKNGPTQRTSDPAVFRIPTDNGIYTITYKPLLFPRQWEVQGPGIVGADKGIEYPETPDCDIAGSFTVKDAAENVLVNIDIDFQAERCPECCGRTGEEDDVEPFACSFLSENPITNLAYHIGDGIEGSAQNDFYSQNGDSYPTTPGNLCEFTVPTTSVNWPSDTWDSRVNYDPETGDWYLIYRGTPTGSQTTIVITNDLLVHECTASISKDYGVPPGSNVFRSLSFDSEGHESCIFPPETAPMALSAMATFVHDEVPEAFQTGCSGCRDVLILLNSMSRERALSNVEILTKDLYRATKMRGRPPHIAKMTLNDCRSIITNAINQI